MEDGGVRARLPVWEEQAERRLGIVENKVDKILDPQEGIYPKLTSIETRLTKWAIAILTSIIGGIVVEILIAKGKT